MLTIKTGMTTEADVARAYAAKDVLVLSGVLDVEGLQKAVPASCTGILSFGLCGGLRPNLPAVGQTLIATQLLAPGGWVYQPDIAWIKRLFAATHAYCQPWFSSGVFNQANTPAQRGALYAQYGAWAIDDESFFVAQFAKGRGIPFVVMRTVSDAWDDNVSITSNILTANGGVDVFSVLSDLAADPAEMIGIWRDYSLSMTELGTAAIEAGPQFQAL